MCKPVYAVPPPGLQSREFRVIGNDPLIPQHALRHPSHKVVQMLTIVVSPRVHDDAMEIDLSRQVGDFWQDFFERDHFGDLVLWELSEPDGWRESFQCSSVGFEGMDEVVGCEDVTEEFFGWREAVVECLWFRDEICGFLVVWWVRWWCAVLFEATERVFIWWLLWHENGLTLDSPVSWTEFSLLLILVGSVWTYLYNTVVFLLIGFWWWFWAV
jgi:hypothetical protein